VAGISLGCLLSLVGCSQPIDVECSKPVCSNSQNNLDKAMPVHPCGLQAPLSQATSEQCAVTRVESWSAIDPQVRLVGTMSGEPWAAESANSQEARQSNEGPLLRRLPPVVTVPAILNGQPSAATFDHPPVVLLPPQPALLWKSSRNEMGQQPQSGWPDDLTGHEFAESDVIGSSSATPEESPEESSEPSWNNISDADAALFTGVWTGAKNHDVALAKIQHGYLLADRHAYYAAQQEFIQVLRMVSRTADAREQTTVRTTDLASGLRALEEAEDFVPTGTGLEADLNVAIIASAHRTSVMQDSQLAQIQPRQLMDRYFRFAQIKLAAAVSDDPDGSMALHALGKLQRRLSQLEPKEHPLAHRQAFAFQQAALLSHRYNHLAAHELGVLLADAGRYPEAVSLLEQVAAKEPHSVVLRNLAQVQYKLGRAGLAAANDRQANLLASQSGDRGSKVQWVSPQEFSRAADATTFGMPVESRTDGAPVSMAPAIAASYPVGPPSMDSQQPAHISRVPDSQSHPSYLRGAQ
jgi:tetratricopeptide (TPR) repeat protein